MKNKEIIILILALILLICPLAALGQKRGEKPNEKSTQAEKVAENSDGDTILVFSPRNNRTEKINLFEYVVGCVASEIPPTYHTQAIKAQAVAAYTYAVKERSEGKKDSLSGAHISASSQTHQGYIDKKEREKRWGEKYKTYEEKIEKAVKSVYGEKITYDGELITAAYHAISCGKTFSALEVWGSDVPYLQSTVSAGDRLSPDFSDTLIYSQEEFSDCAEKLKNVKLGKDAKNWVEKTEKYPSGCVNFVILAGEKISAQDFRQAFKIKSLCFDIEYRDKSFIIKTVGSGHGVGMSQYGADYMARQGKTYDEILKHYYKGTRIEK